MQKLILTKATCEAHDLDFILIALQLSESFKEIKQLITNSVYSRRYSGPQSHYCTKP